MPSNETEEFEFRLRAERESGGEKPSAAPEPTPTVSFGRDILAPSAANLVDIGRGALAGTVSAPGELSKVAQQGANWVNRQMGGDPKFWSGTTALPEFESTVSRIPRLGLPATPQQKGFEELGSAVAPMPLTVPGAVARGAMKVPGAVARGLESVKGAPSAIKSVADTLSGTGATAAGAEAQVASRGALADISKAHGATQASKMGEAFTLEDVSTRLQRELDATSARGGRPTLDKQGKILRGAVSGSYDVAKEARTKLTKDLYAKAEQAAAARERDGARIDVSTVTPKVEKMLELAENIPDLKGKLGKLINAVTGVEEKAGVAAPIGVGKVSSRVTPARTPLPPKPGLTYQELDLANKYLKDIAYSGEMQGYDSIVRRAALDLSKGLDTQIAKFVPEHAKAASEYARLSEPLESFATRIGKAVTSTEGGIKGDSYAKIASQNLPQKLFGTRDSIELVVDALAGGKKGPARAAAQAKVDQLVEHWIMEGARGAEGRVGAGAAKQLAAPQMQATMQAVPRVGQRVTEQLGREAATESKIAQAGAGAKAARGEAEIAASAKAKVDKALAQADVDFTHGSKSKAYDGYVSALRQSMAGDPERYRAAIALIERAGTLQAKTDKARSLAKRFAWGGGLAVAGFEAKELVK